MPPKFAPKPFRQTDAESAPLLQPTMDAETAPLLQPCNITLATLLKLHKDAANDPALYAAVFAPHRGANGAVICAACGRAMTQHSNEGAASVAKDAPVGVPVAAAAVLGSAEAPIFIREAPRTSTGDVVEYKVEIPLGGNVTTGSTMLPLISYGVVGFTWLFFISMAAAGMPAFTIICALGMIGGACCFMVFAACSTLTYRVMCTTRQLDPEEVTQQVRSGASRVRWQAGAYTDYFDAVRIVDDSYACDTPDPSLDAVFVVTPRVIMFRDRETANSYKNQLQRFITLKQHRGVAQETLEVDGFPTSVQLYQGRPWQGRSKTVFKIMAFFGLMFMNCNAKVGKVSCTARKIFETHDGPIHNS
jgi:hypothetical protein